MEEPVHQRQQQLVTDEMDITKSETTTTVPKRKLVPQLIESSSRSSKILDDEDTTPGISASPESRGRFQPQLIETTTGHRGGKAVKFHDHDRTRPRKRIPAATIPALETKSKKFTPQLIETAKRSFRQNDPSSPSGSLIQNRNRIRIAGWNGPLRPRPPHEEESRFSYANLARRRETRQHSFRVPDLPAIRSSSSDESFPSPLSSSSISPAFTTKDNSQDCEVHIQSQKRTHEHTDESFIDVDFYSLPARTRNKLLSEALAAFPNEQVYQSVSHFAIDREDGDDTADDDSSVGIATRSVSLVTRFRRESSVDLTWELDEMRRHKEESEMREREKRFASQRSPFSAAALAARRTADDMHFLSGIDYDAPKRRAVRPPMLGNDIIFPQCESPQTTRCEIKDHALASNGEAQEVQPSPLWAPELHVDVCEEPGLWNGTCKKPSAMDIVALPSPQIAVPSTKPSSASLERTAVSADVTLAVPTPEPLCSKPKKQGEDAHSREENIQREFNDSFVTQIYNYLSLGYPCLAHDYDEEISSVSGIPVEELRKDDQLANAKGYLGAPERPLSKGQDGMCMRWRALKLYIHEWARRQPRSTNPESGLEGWGVRARGSWAV